MSYSKDLRERVVKYRLSGHTIKETCKVFGVGNYAVSKWVKQYKETGDLSNKPLNRGYKKIDPEKLKAYIVEHPDAYQREIAEAFACSGSWKSIKTSWNYTKKKTLRYCEQKEEQVKEYLNKIADIPKERIAYVDETGIDSYLYRVYGYTPKGEPVWGKIPGRKFQRTNIVAAKLRKHIVAPMQYNGITDSTLFEFWFEQWLLPGLPEDAVIVMDYASFHRKKQLTAISVRHQRTLIFLPPYSPDLNPIEIFWAYLKSIIRTSIPAFDSLDDAISFAFQVC